MARDRISTSTKDLTSDGGSVLLSIVVGEQLELPVTLDMVAVANSDYTYEAVLVEGLNTADGKLPLGIQPAGVIDILPTRECEYNNTWVATTAYDREDVVDYGDDSYRLMTGSGRISSITPDTDELWTLHDKRIMYIQFESTLITGYVAPPIPDKPIYAFLELRVTEVADSIFINTWKPVRGLVEFLFSPTELSP